MTSDFHCLTKNDIAINFAAHVRVPKEVLEHASLIELVELMRRKLDEPTVIN